MTDELAICSDPQVFQMLMHFAQGPELDVNSVESVQWLKATKAALSGRSQADGWDKTETSLSAAVRRCTCSSRAQTTGSFAYMVNLVLLVMETNRCDNSLWWL